jgi:hypothetical protein
LKFEGDSNTYNYKFEMPNLLNGWQYYFRLLPLIKVDAKELGLSSQESSFNENQVHAFCGTPSNDFTSDNPSKKVGVYPNPYSTTAAWDGVGSRDRKLYFYNFAQPLRNHLYTTSGDAFEHDT